MLYHLTVLARRGQQRRATNKRPVKVIHEKNFTKFMGKSQNHETCKPRKFSAIRYLLQKVSGERVKYLNTPFLPARASEQGNVIGRVGVRVYIIYNIYICHQKKIVIERTRDLNDLKFVATDFSLKTISPSAGENSGDLA